MPNKLELEIKIVKRFIDLIGNKDKIVNPLFNRVQVYQDMVYFHFYETISNLLPLFCKTISQKKLKNGFLNLLTINLVVLICGKYLMSFLHIF